jgi:hypothetical protein
MTLNFTTMTIGDLRAYVLAHREDTAAFQTLIVGVASPLENRLKVNAQ